jgi:hypothetical protein
MAMAFDWEQLGRQFVTTYYQTFDTDRLAVLPLYHSSAMMTFEDSIVQGHESIREALANKPFQTIQHIITKLDCQPTVDRGVIILVTGRLKADEDPPHAFSQMFFIKPCDNSFYIYHDIFRLSIHNV